MMANSDDVVRKSETGISVIIVGAGVGGIMTALECWRQGHNVRILDRSAGPETEGDFFTIGPSALKCFRHWPKLDRDNDKVAYDPWITYLKQNGEVILPPAPMIFSSTDETGKDTTVRIHRHLRSKFQEILLRQLTAIELHVEYGHRAIEYFEDIGHGGVIFENGVKLQADLIVAADGLGTKSNKLIAATEVKARSNGYAIYRTAFPVELVTADPEIDKRFAILENGHLVNELWVGPDVCLTVGRTEDMFSWTLTHKDDGDSAEIWNGTRSSVDLEDVIKHLDQSATDWPEIVKKFVRLTPVDRLVDWKIMWREPQEQWTSPHGRIVQIGDAAHTFVPSSGNGATQAIEDATSLSACLRLGGRDNIKWATKVHNTLRYDRISCGQITGIQNQANRHNTNWNRVAANPNAIKASYGRWIWSHDAEKYAYDNYEKALDHVVNGTPFKNSNVPPGYVYKPWNIDELLSVQNSGRMIVFEGDWS